MVSCPFIAGLPSDEFLPWELSLREQLINVVDQVVDEFPLAEWIEQRVGAELVVDVNVKGKLSIRRFEDSMHAPTDESSASNVPSLNSVFFGSFLPSSGLLEEEKALVDSLYDCLAAMPQADLPTVQAAVFGADPLVQQRREELFDRFVKFNMREGIIRGKEFHWKHLQLITWINRRVGHEIKIPANKRVLLTAVGQSRLEEKRRQRMPSLNSAFFDFLPTNGLLAEEAALVDALYDCLAAVPQAEFPNVKVAVFGADPLVQQKREELFDRFVEYNTREGIILGKQLHWKHLKLNAWVNRRIGDEIKLSSSNNVILTPAGKSRLEEKRKRSSSEFGWPSHAARPSKAPRLTC